MSGICRRALMWLREQNCANSSKVSAASARQRRQYAALGDVFYRYHLGALVRLDPAKQRMLRSAERLAGAPPSGICGGVLGDAEKNSCTAASSTPKVCV